MIEQPIGSLVEGASVPVLLYCLVMTCYILYNKATPDERWAEDLVKSLGAEQVEAELLDADSPRGIQLAENYDVLGRPSVLLLGPSGSPFQVWQGREALPTVKEIAYLARQ
jgi:hypothetical protein